MRPLGVPYLMRPPEWFPNALAVGWLSQVDCPIANPLTALVMVPISSCKIILGNGWIVATPMTSAAWAAGPRTPNLSIGLANQFVEGGLPMTPLHRLIRLSSTYQQDYP